MKLILLGTTGYHPNDRRQTACLMLPELGVLFDAGTAIYRASDHVETSSLDILNEYATAWDHIDAHAETHDPGLVFDPRQDLIGVKDPGLRLAHGLLLE